MSVAEVVNIIVDFEATSKAAEGLESSRGRGIEKEGRGVEKSCSRTRTQKLKRQPAAAAL